MRLADKSTQIPEAQMYKLTVVKNELYRGRHNTVKYSKENVPSTLYLYTQNGGMWLCVSSPQMYLEFPPIPPFF